MKLISIAANEYNEKINKLMENYECLIIENYENNIDEKLFYSSLNHLKQLNKSILIPSVKVKGIASLNISNLLV